MVNGVMADEVAAPETSSLSPATSISPPSSFRTAKASLSTGTGDATDVSSPGEALEPHSYREARQLPHELKEHCQIHLEERLFGSALQLLDSTLSASNARKDPSPHKAALIPPPNQLSLLGTLAIHPSHTTRCREPGDIYVSPQALEYLRNLSATVGPINANLRTALEFQGSSSRNFRRGRLNAHDTDSDDGNLEGDEKLEGPLANESSIWSNAPDFWTALGWAFQCSVAHPHRWRYWKVWLECMLEIIENDWDQRLRLDAHLQEQEGPADITEHDFPFIRQSILMMYLDSLRRERKNVLRELMRSLFAFTDGSMVDASVYKELFPNEPLTPTKNKRKREEPALDLEHDQFGDYLDEEDFDFDEDDGSPAPGGRTGLRGAKTKRGPDPRPLNPSACPGMVETVEIRLRLFSLLSAVFFYLRGSFDPIGELYDKFATSVRGLPLDLFRLFVSSHSTPLPDDVYVSFLRGIVDKLLPNHPDPGSVDPETDDHYGVSVDILRRCFLPFAANKIFTEDNAKLSLVLEHMLRFLWTRSRIPRASSLRPAIEAGIAARNEKSKSRKVGRTKKVEAAESSARQILDDSSQSLTILIELIEDSDCMEI